MPKALSVLAGLVLLMIVPMAHAAEPYPVFQVDPNWPKQLPHGYIFGPSGGVTVDSHDHVWIYSRPATVRVASSS